MAMAKVRVNELRKLTLPIETVVDAVLELDRSHGGTLAIGQLMEVRVETGAQAGLTLVVMQGSGSAAAAVQKHYTLPAVAAAVIHYCFRARIPLPRQATKSIEVVAEGFQLTIQTTTEVLRLHGELPQVSQVAVGVARRTRSSPPGMQRWMIRPALKSRQPLRRPPKPYPPRPPPRRLPPPEAPAADIIQGSHVRLPAIVSVCGDFPRRAMCFSPRGAVASLQSWQRITTTWSFRACNRPPVR